VRQGERLRMVAAVAGFLGRATATLAINGPGANALDVLLDVIAEADLPPLEAHTLARGLSHREVLAGTPPPRRLPPPPRHR
jgi:hypothetical protein